MDVWAGFALWIPSARSGLSARCWRLGDPGPTLDQRIAEREALEAIREHWTREPLPDVSSW